MAKKAKQKLGPLQKKWLKALRSGKYKQTDSVLHKVEQNGKQTHSFCCLGVACELLKIPALKVGSLESGDYENVIYKSGKAKHEGVMPGTSWKLLGLFGSTGAANPESIISDALTDLNDSKKSFKKIAAIIERDPSVYFKAPK